MSMMDYMRFINEEIRVGGQPTPDDDDNQAPTYGDDDDAGGEDTGTAPPRA